MKDLKSPISSASNTISLLGSGWLGLPLAKSLQKWASSVKVSTTQAAKLEPLGELGLNPYLVELGSNLTCPLEFLQSDILIVGITSKDESGFQKLVEHIAKSPIKRVLFISSTSVYPLLNSELDENSPVKNCPLTRIESMFTIRTEFKTSILRFGGLFGGERQPGNFLKPNKPMSQPEGYINLIHLTDCIAIIQEIISQNAWGETFNACAPTHPTRREFYTHQAKLLGNTEFCFAPCEPVQYKKINSSKLIKRLNYQFKLPNLMDYSPELSITTP